MRIIERLKLQIRAYKYKNSNDIGGIAFMRASIKNGQISMDIGAHKAGYLYWMLKLVGETGKVIAFEPQSFLFEYITSIKKLFKWNNVIVEHLALSDIIGKTKLYIPINKTKKQSSPGATLLKVTNQKQIEKTEIIQTQTLDNYCSLKNIKPNFLKIDVEGNELNVFKGGEKIIRKYKPKILVEIEARHVGIERVQETFQFLQALGYNGYFIHGSKYRKISKFSFEKFQNINDMKNYCNNFTFEIS